MPPRRSSRRSSRRPPSSSRSASVVPTPPATRSSPTRSLMMKNSGEGSSSRPSPQAIDLFEQVKEAHGLGPQELCKLLKDSESVSFMHKTENGSFLKIDVEKLARLLPLHLIAVVLNSERNKVLLAYLLCGLRLLYSICEASSRLPKIEQVFLEDVKVMEQVIDLVFYLLTVCSNFRETVFAGDILLLHSTIVACSMHLLSHCISMHWNELAYVLSSHPKVDIFMDTSFRSVHINVRSLQARILAQKNERSEDSSLFNVSSVTHVCLQCEASLQFLLLLCQQKPFLVLVRENKELCAKGGILRVAITVLKLDISTPYDGSPSIVAAICRLKSKALSILLLLCETDNATFLDDVAGTPESLSLAKAVVCEVISLLKSMAGKGCQQPCSPSDKVYPTGILQLNALHLAEIFSDDSNLRSYITTYFYVDLVYNTLPQLFQLTSPAEVLAIILSLPCEEFLSSWCSSDLPSREVDAELVYDPFTAAGWVMNSLSSNTMKNIVDSLSYKVNDITDSLSSLNINDGEYMEIRFQPSNTPPASYAHLRTSLLVKIIANLHCFLPSYSKGHEINFFFNRLLESLQLQFPNSGTGVGFAGDGRMAATVGKNLRALFGHTESLIPAYLSLEDVKVFRVFSKQLRSIICPNEPSDTEDDPYVRGYSSTPPRNVNPDHKNANGNQREEMSESSDMLAMDLPAVPSEPVEAEITEDWRNSSDRLNQVAARSGLMNNGKDAHHAGETSGSESSPTRRKAPAVCEETGENPELHEEGVAGGVQEEGVEVAAEKQRRKRKRTVMNDEQVSIMEKALLEEPEMQKNAASLKAWAEKLGSYGSEVTTSQLKNWLNNRKARLARLAKESRQIPDASAPSHANQSTPETASASEPPSGQPDPKGKSAETRATTPPPGPSTTQPVEIITIEDSPPPRNNRVQPSTSLQPGQYVLILNDQGAPMARARIHQVTGKIDGIGLEETGTCIIDVIGYFPGRVSGVGDLPPGDVGVGNKRMIWERSRMIVQ